MKTAIFNHPFTDFYTSPNRLNSYILEYLADIIIPFESAVFDVVKSRKEKIDLPEDLKYLKQFMNNDLTGYSFFHSYYKFGDERNFNHKYLKVFSPDVILITSFAFCYFEGFKMMADYLKRLNKGFIIICGGAGPSCYPEYYLRNSKADYVVAGPAETVLGKLLNNIEKGRKEKLFNVYTRNDINFDRKEIKYDFKPFIAEKNSKTIQMQLTRGCPKKCSYCSVNLTSGNIYLKSEIKDIDNKLAAFKKNDNVNIDIEDDNISFDRDYLKEVLKIINENFKKYTLSFENGIDFTTLDDELINKLISNNLKQWNLSLAAVNQDVLKRTGRNYNKSNFDDIINNIKKYEKLIIVYFICGLPQDNEDNIFETIMYLAEKNILIGISNFYPVPNTGIIKNINININPELMKGSSFYKWGNITCEKLITFFMISRFINAINKFTPADFEQIRSNKLICDYKRELSNKNEIQAFFDNCSRDRLTLTGIYLSLSLREIISIENMKDNDYMIKKYKLNKKLMGKFFNKLVKIERLREFKLPENT